MQPFPLSRNQDRSSNLEVVGLNTVSSDSILCLAKGWKDIDANRIEISLHQDDIIANKYFFRTLND